MVVNYLRGFDFSGEGIAGVNGVHCQSARCEFPLRLLQQVKPIYDEVELGNNLLLLKIICQKTHVIVGQRCFTTALGVPDDAFLDTLVSSLNLINVPFYCYVKSRGGYDDFMCLQKLVTQSSRCLHLTRS